MNVKHVKLVKICDIKVSITACFSHEMPLKAVKNNIHI